ncbi:hypothetical protein I546_7358 [Mycobacterium kansasii 732]|nr:hypothetical protein I546_7358 [Mycobacterium kansasii 732]
MRSSSTSTATLVRPRSGSGGKAALIPISPSRCRARRGQRDPHRGRHAGAYSTLAAHYDDATIARLLAGKA